MVSRRQISGLVSLGSALLLACGGLRVEVEVAKGMKNLAVDAIAVWPFSFRYKVEAYQVYEKSYDMIQAVLERRAFMVLAPDDFEVTDTRGVHPFVASDLALRSARLSIHPRRLAVLRAHAEERVATSDKQLVDGRGQVRGYRKDYERSVVVDVGIFHPDSGERLVSARTVVVEDPFAAKPAADLRPEVRRALRRALEVALDRLEGMSAKRKWRWADVRVRANPRPGFSYLTEALEPLSRRLAGMNFIEADGVKFTRYQYFYPDLSARDFSTFERSPYGLLVSGVSDGVFREAGLVGGDVILKVGAVEMTGEYRFRRAVALAKPGDRIMLTILRGRAQQELVVTIK